MRRKVTSSLWPAMDSQESPPPPLILVSSLPCLKDAPNHSVPPLTSGAFRKSSAFFLPDDREGPRPAGLPCGGLRGLVPTLVSRTPRASCPSDQNGLITHVSSLTFADRPIDREQSSVARTVTNCPVSYTQCREPSKVRSHVPLMQM